MVNAVPSRLSYCAALRNRLLSVRALRQLLAVSLVGVMWFVGVAGAQDLKLAENENALEQAVAEKLLRTIYQKAGLKFVAEPLPAARANALTLDGKMDGEVARITTYAAKNPPLIRVDPPYHYLTTTVFAKVERKLSLRDKASLRDYRVGAVRGVAHAEAAVAGLKDATLVGSYEQLYRMLESGRIDLAIDTGVNGRKMIQSMKLAGIGEAGELARFKLHHILHPRHEKLVPRIAEVINQLTNSGELARLAERYEAELMGSSSRN